MLFISKSNESASIIVFSIKSPPNFTLFSGFSDKPLDADISGVSPSDCYCN
jgi:hypothetical protein